MTILSRFRRQTIHSDDQQSSPSLLTKLQNVMPQPKFLSQTKRAASVKILTESEKAARQEEVEKAVINALLRTPPPAAKVINPHDVHELVPGKLNMCFHPNQAFSVSEIKRRPELFYFSTDLHERYVPFCKDFGPVSASIAVKFWNHVKTKKNHPNLRARPLTYYTDEQPKNQANSAFLLGIYMMFEENYTAQQAADVFTKLPQHPLLPFRDATYRPSDFDLTLLDCFMGIEKAIKVGWFDPARFDVSVFDALEDPEGGDVSLIGDKFVAFRGPRDVGDQDWALPPSFYFDLFKRLGVSDVVRLNEAESYDKAAFERQGLRVHDLEFPDCTTPPPAHVRRFLDVCDASRGKVAVHCKAGLGRTGTMIALWMMRHKGFTAREAIAWLRVCRAGSVIGKQQHFLAAADDFMWEGNTLIACSRTSSSTSLSSSSSSFSSRRCSVPAFSTAEQEEEEEEAKREGAMAPELARQVEIGSRMRQNARMRARSDEDNGSGFFERTGST